MTMKLLNEARTLKPQTSTLSQRYRHTHTVTPRQKYTHTHTHTHTHTDTHTDKITHADIPLVTIPPHLIPPFNRVIAIRCVWSAGAQILWLGKKLARCSRKEVRSLFFQFRDHSYCIVPIDGRERKGGEKRKLSLY